VASDSNTLSRGRLLGRYELLAAVAKGGMGQVWVGRLHGARGFHKLVAVKTLLSTGGDDERMERMLLEEARIASLIQHSNVVQTMELGEHDGTLYLVMEWVDGEPLSHLLSCAESAGGIPLLVGVNLIAQTLRGLQAAHELCDDAGTPLGVVHRDVSPHNILVSYAGVAKLVDFGIAKAMNQLSSSTETGEVKGKFAYMAPEQILGEEVDQRSDLFAAGIMLYLLTVGRHPFKNHNPAGVLHSITSEEPAARPSTWNAQYSGELEAVVMKALDKEKDGRWASAQEMRLALEAAVPDAFALGIEARVRSFIAETVGDRAARKREALRRAILAVDSRINNSSSVPALAATAQSAGSLRAVSVSELRAAGEEPAPRISRMPTARPPTEPSIVLERRSRRAWVGGAAVAVVLAASAMSLRGTNEARRVPASPSVEMAALPAPSAAHLLGVPVPAVVPEVKLPPVAAATAVATPIPSAARAPNRAAPAHKTVPARPASKASAVHNSDLIAPDYAR
jgi:eukaryotic-like serine/threonine-protein kinase